MMNCITYARVSTDKQADRELSIPAQLQAMRQHAKSREWTIVHEFIEAGISARTADRPSLRALLSRCREGNPKIDIVLVHKVDRLARNLADHVAILALLKEQGVALAAVAEKLDDSTSGKLVEHIMASLAEFYSANLSEEVKKGMRQKIAQDGWPHLPPFGYRSVRGQVTVDPTLGSIVRQAFEVYARGDTTLTALCSRLSGPGRRFSVSGLQRLLRNPFYTGKLRWQGDEFQGRHEALVPSELFARVQTVLDSRTRRMISNPRHDRWLRGFAQCAKCGSRMSSEAHDRFAYYRCRRNTAKRDRCWARWCNVERADRAVLEIYGRLPLPPAVREQLLRRIEDLLLPEQGLRTEDLTFVRTRLRQIEASAIELATQFADGILDVELYRMTTLRLQQERREMNHRLRVLEKIPERLEFRSDAVSLLDLHHELPLKAQQALLTLVLSTLKLSPEGVTSYALFPPFDVLDTSPQSTAA